MIRAVKVEAMDNRMLLVEFANGEKKIFDCKPLLKNSLYAELKDADFFRTVHIDDMGLVCWNDHTDIDPYTLYEDSESLALQVQENISGKDAGNAKDLEYILWNVADAYLGFVKAVLCYTDGNIQRADSVKEYITEHPSALTSDILEFIADQDDFQKYVSEQNNR